MDDDPHTTLEARRFFAETLRMAREQYGWETGQGDITQRQFAQMLGISGDRPEERYRLYENAKREPPLWILAAIRRVTGYSLDEIIAQLPAGRPVIRPRPSRAPARPNGVGPPPDPIPGGSVAKNADSQDNEKIVRLRPVPA
jgi:transcriptional regulator with XRE-family HTH domain